MTDQPTPHVPDRVPRWRRAWFRCLHLLVWAWFLLCFRFRLWGVRHVPTDGPVLLLGNHQSWLDLMAFGQGVLNRPFFPMARSTLWRTGLGAFVMNAFNAIPVQRGEADTQALRACIDALGRGHAVLIYPEGTRSPDGQVHPFRPGTLLLIRRARPPIVPVAIDGSFAAWPRHRRRPRLLGRVGIMFGQPVPADALLGMSAGDALEYLRSTVEGMRQDVARRLAAGRDPYSTGYNAGLGIATEAGVPDAGRDQRS